jgi:peptidyl-tRNA hydrolase, PTH1 family
LPTPPATAGAIRTRRGQVDTDASRPYAPGSVVIRLIVFLGNPGRQYRDTRHNVGWMLADHLSFAAHLRWQKKFKGEYAQHPLAGGTVALLKPLTMMNRSGESVVAARAFFKIPPEEIVVAYDDVELNFGTLNLRMGGGLAGHNGVRSVAQLLGTREFHRCRLGVSRPRSGDLASYVLSRFSPQEEQRLPGHLDEAARDLESYIAAAG